MTYNNSKIFFSERRANEFAAIVNGDVWSKRDCFGQTMYIVEW